MSYSSQRHKNCRYNGSPFSLFTRQQIYFSCSASCENRTPDDSWKSIGNNATSFFFGFRAIIPSLFRSRFQDYLGRQVELHVPSQLYLIILPFFFFLPVDKCSGKASILFASRETLFSRERQCEMINWHRETSLRRVYPKNKTSPGIEWSQSYKIKRDPIRHIRLVNVYHSLAFIRSVD